MTLANLCNATPGDLKEAVEILNHIHEEEKRLNQLGVGRQYEAEARDLYNLYLLAKDFPEHLHMVYHFEEGQEEMEIFSYNNHEEYLQKAYRWICYANGMIYNVDATSVEAIFEFLKYNYLEGTLSVFHPAYNTVKPKKYGDCPYFFANFVSQTEKLYLKEYRK